MIPTHNLLNFFDIFEGCAHGGSPWLLVLQLCSAPLEVRVPLKTAHSTDVFIALGLLKHFSGLRCWFLESDTEFDVSSRFMFEVHSEIANEHMHMFTRMHVIQVLTLNAWRHAAFWPSKVTACFCWVRMTLFGCNTEQSQNFLIAPCTVGCKWLKRPVHGRKVTIVHSLKLDRTEQCDA